MTEFEKAIIYAIDAMNIFDSRRVNTDRYPHGVARDSDNAAADYSVYLCIENGKFYEDIDVMRMNPLSVEYILVKFDITEEELTIAKIKG